MKNFTGKSFQIRVVAVLFALFSASLAFGEVREISDLNEVQVLAASKAAEYGAENVLVVFDIDNTILATPQNFGSDQWVEWQLDLIKNGEVEHAVANSPQELFALQANLYSLSRMRLTQPDTASIVGEIQKMGVGAIALTARGSASRDATQRELKANGINFSLSGLGSQTNQRNGFAGNYLPLNASYPHIFGLTSDEVDSYKLQNPRMVSYENGVMMVAGQHKGGMLRTLMQKTASAFKVVIFVDDKLRNVEKVEAGMKPVTTEVYSLRYSGEDEMVQNFKLSDKSRSIDSWKQLNAALEATFK